MKTTAPAVAWRGYRKRAAPLVLIAIFSEMLGAFFIAGCLGDFFSGASLRLSAAFVENDLDIFTGVEQLLSEPRKRGKAKPSN